MLSEVERGVKNPTVKLAYQIARALGCSQEEKKFSVTGTDHGLPAGPSAIIKILSTLRRQ